MSNNEFPEIASPVRRLVRDESGALVETVIKTNNDVDEPIFYEEPVPQTEEPPINEVPAVPSFASERPRLPSFKDKVLRSIGVVTLAGVGLTGVAGVSNFVSTKVRYGVEIGWRQQIENVGQLPNEIDKGVQKIQKAVDVINLFN